MVGGFIIGLNVSPIGQIHGVQRISDPALHMAYVTSRADRGDCAIGPINQLINHVSTEICNLLLGFGLLVLLDHLLDLVIQLFPHLGPSVIGHSLSLQ